MSRRYRITFGIVMGLAAGFMSACSGIDKGGRSPLSPSAVESAGGNFGAAAHQSVVPGLGSAAQCSQTVTWDDVVFGKVIITNGPVPCDYLFIGWEATDEVNQVNLAEVGKTFAAGETATLTLGFPMVCDMKLQRDIYAGIKPTSSDPRFAGYRYTMSDVLNYFETGNEKFTYTSTCPPVIPPPPPPPTPECEGEECEEEPELCTDDSANNYGGSLPCTYDPPPPPCPEGYYRPEQFGPTTFGWDEEPNIPEGCVPVPPPPPPPDLAWCHVAALPSGVVENDLNIPQTAIDNGHDDHELDYPGPCDGRSENLQTYYYYTLDDIDDGDWGPGATTGNAGGSDGNSDNDDDRQRFCSAQGGMWLNDSNDGSFNPSGGNICRVANTLNVNANRSGSSNDFNINASDLEDTHVQ